MQNMTIARAAREAGVGVETIRFYERRGLIEQPPRPRGSGFRTYLPEQVKRVRFIRQAQQIGFSLREIKELLSLRADPAADCSVVRSQAVTKLEEVKRKIEQLHRIEQALEDLIAICPGRGAIEACTILDTLADSAQHSSARRHVPSADTDPLPKRSSKRNGVGMDAGRRRLPTAKETSVKSVTLKIEGMNCDGCAATLHALVQRQAGVKAATVTFEGGEARILYDPAVIDEDRLVAAVERPGYRVTSRMT